MFAAWTDNIKKRVSRYLLQRYLGQYLQEKLTLDQLTVDLYNGTGNVTDVELDCEALNALAEQQNIPIEFVGGHLDNISVSIPWSSIMSDSCEIEISGLQITVQPKKRLDNGSSMLDSMWNSMASSMQLAEECLKSVDSDDEPEFNYNQTQESSQRLTGLETCAQTIDAMLSRVKMILRDSIIRIERNQKESDVGIAVDFKVKLLKFSDEGSSGGREELHSYESAFSFKKIVLEGVSCYSDIFKNDHFNILHKFQNNSSDNTAGTPTDETPQEDNAVLLGKFSGRHEIKFQIKNDDSIGGPQIKLDCTFGSVIALMTPIQIHIIYRIIDELLNPDLSTDGDDFLRRRFCKEKPMDSFDYRKVEEELQDKLNPGRIGLSGLQQPQGGWSSPCLDDSDEEFLPFNSKAGMYSSANSTFMNASTTSITSSLQQSLSESTCSTTLTSKFLYPSQNQHNMIQNCVEKTKFSISFASAAFILLHDDILTLSPKVGVELSSVDKMKEFSRNFFNKLNLFGATVSGKKDIDKVRSQLTDACSLSNLRLISAPLKLEGAVNIVSSNSVTNGHISFGYCELVESINSFKETGKVSPPEVVEILNFPNFEAGTCNSVRIKFSHKSYKSRASISKTSLKIDLQPFKSEIDISLVDRIYSLIHPQLTFYTIPRAKAEPLGYQAVSNINSKDHSIFKIAMECPSCEVNFRFPIPDLRSVDDPQRLNSKIRNLRNDSIVFDFNNLKFETILNSNVNIIELDTKCNKLCLLYKETQANSPIKIATALSEEPEADSTPMPSHQGFDWPRLVVTMYPPKPVDVIIDHEHSDEGESMDNYISNKPKDSSPFSSRRIVHQCLNSQEKENNVDGFGESVIPGDRSEINQFMDVASSNTLYKVELSLRFVEVALPSKHLYEEIYNRVSTDLLLWEPTIPQNFDISSLSKQFQSNFAAQTLLPMCKSSAKYDSESESEEEMSAFYNPNEPTSYVSYNKKSKRNSGNGQSDLSFHITIDKGLCSLYTPFSDPLGNTVPGQKGQISLKVEQGSIFIVSGFKGNPNLGYMCIHSRSATFHHSDLIRNGEEIPVLRKDLHPTIYPSEEGVLTRLNTDSSISDHTDMLSVAIRIERDHSRNVKTFKVATAIKDGTLGHRMSHPNRSWFTQLKDFFDVTDTPIMGYSPATVLTELHLHLWNCAVDYRPLNLPLRSILTMNNFSISTNIAAQTSTSVIRFIAEDAALMITTNADSTDLFHDYVCVMDMDLFELSLRHCANRQSTAPRMEMTASNNVLHIRTCSDSFKALSDLITYLANYGDLTDPNASKEEDKVPYSPIKECNSEPNLIDTDDGIDKERRMSVSQTEHVHDLVAEAMEDSCQDICPNVSQSQPQVIKNVANSRRTKQTLEIHFSPNDEDENMYESKIVTPSPSVYPILETSSSLPIDLIQSDEDEEEFCILENDPGVGILRKQGEPEARTLSDEPIRVIENHFSTPIGTRNILETPKHYPDPVMRYALHEMSIVWHLYGGEDFKTQSSSKYSRFDESGPSEISINDNWKKDSCMYEQSEVDIAIDALNPGAVFSKTKAFESAWEAYESPKAQRKKIVDSISSWRTQGGKGRKLNILVELHLYKIKFQHEVYPESASQASRQVLVIKNIEIRDRLSSSQFNKMLYLYTSPAFPKQSHANMLVIKAAHIRPDPQLNIKECLLKVSVLPIRLNIDQDALLFLYQFYADFAGKIDGDDEDGFTPKPPSHTPSIESLPVMTVNMADADGLTMCDDDDVSNLLIFSDEPISQEDNVSVCSKDPSVDSYKSSSPIYFRQITFSPEVPIRLDYRGKRVDMTHGPLAGLLMGLAQLNCSEIELKRISHRNGILGVDKLVAFMANEWASEIRKNQLPRLLGGVGPLHSFVQLFQGIRDLFWLPIEQYQKDGRIAKGIQKGANAFSTSAAMAALELTNRLVQTIQSAAEFTYDMVSPGPSVQQQRRQLSTKRKRYTQPSDIREGVTNAYNVVKDGLGDTAHTIVRVASKEHEQKGVSGAVGGVLRQIPPTIVRPIILAAEATSNVLDGFRSQLEPDFKKEAEEKWKES